MTGGPAEGELSVVLSADVGQIEGSVENDAAEPAGAATVTVVPSGASPAKSLFKIGQTDPKGHFTIRGIAPGTYKVFAWDHLDFNAAVYDPDFLKPFDSMGQEIQIQENGKESVQLKLIKNPEDE